MVAGDSGSTDAGADELSTDGEVGGEGPGEAFLGARGLRGFAVALVAFAVALVAFAVALVALEGWDLGVFLDFLARPIWAKTLWNIFLPTNLLWIPNQQTSFILK
jgi:hypothetical protein